MKIRPKLDYKLLGTDIQLNKNKVYNAIVSTNIPEYKEKELIFVNVRGDYEFMLEKGEYIIVKK